MLTKIYNLNPAAKKNIYSKFEKNFEKMHRVV